MRGTWLALLCGCGRLNFDPAGDASLPGDGAIANIGGVSDDFDDGTKSPIWFTYDDLPTGSSFSEEGGVLTIDLGIGVADSYAGYVAMTTGTLREAAALVEIVDTPISGNAGCYLTVETETEVHSLSLATNVGMLITLIDGIPHHEVAFQRDAHRWWRIRESGGFVRWEISGDGVAFTEIDRVATPSFVDALVVNLGGGTQASLPTPGTCSFDNFNLPP